MKYSYFKKLGCIFLLSGLCFITNAGEKILQPIRESSPCRQLAYKSSDSAEVITYKWEILYNFFTDQGRNLFSFPPEIFGLIGQYFSFDELRYMLFPNAPSVELEYLKDTIIFSQSIDTSSMGVPVFTDDKTIMATCQKNNTVKFFSLTDKPLHMSDIIPFSTRDFALNQDATKVIVPTYNERTKSNKALLFDGLTGKLLITFDTEDLSIRKVGLNNEGSYAFIYSYKRDNWYKLQIWNTETGSILFDAWYPITELTFSLDGTELYLLSFGELVTIDLQGKTLSKKTLVPSENNFIYSYDIIDTENSFLFSGDKTKLCVITKRKTHLPKKTISHIRIIDRATGKNICEYSLETNVWRNLAINYDASKAILFNSADIDKIGEAAAIFDLLVNPTSESNASTIYSPEDKIVTISTSEDKKYIQKVRYVQTDKQKSKFAAFIHNSDQIVIGNKSGLIHIGDVTNPEYEKTKKTLSPILYTVIKAAHEAKIKGETFTLPLNSSHLKTFQALPQSVLKYLTESLDIKEEQPYVEPKAQCDKKTFLFEPMVGNTIHGRWF